MAWSDLLCEKSIQQFYNGDEVWLDIDDRGNVRCVVMLPRQDGTNWSYRLREIGHTEDLDDGRWVPQNERLKMAKRGPNNPRYKAPTPSTT